MADWPEVSLEDVRKAYKGRHEIYEEIKYWMTEKGWRVRDQGHGFTLWPPDTGVRLVPPWVIIGSTPEGNPTWHAKRLRRECRAMQKIVDADIE
ncbi:hypothetical protein ACNO8X_26040 [Mycobacterium sp. PDNC021]|uniref:hypothetical protein n=1 Tax=Mycobacterium sp. PDNC021 TaxID=3391399 RepID=UPI003AACBBC3